MTEEWEEREGVGRGGLGQMGGGGGGCDLNFFIPLRNHIMTFKSTK